jgi:osmotically-inducible protein OsmY
MTTDQQLQQDVTDELFWDPKLDSDAIAVSADNGIVTLRGTVGGPREKHEASKAAQRVIGVILVINDLEVRPLNEDRRDDAELRGDVLRAFTLNSVVPPTVDAHVKDGFVTLTGSASWQFERDEAETVATSVPGVTGVQDEVVLSGPRPDASDIGHAIQKAFRRNAKLDANSIQVETKNGVVSLTGSVRSWSEHDAALAAAWSAPGVSQVEDHVTVTY